MDKDTLTNPARTTASSAAAHHDTLMVVDDNEENRTALARLLERHGYHAVTARGGRHALELLEQHAIDLVLLDVMMQDMNGLEVLQALRARRSASELPVIMTTARDESEEIVRALQLGANDYVTKPLDLAVLLARIQTQLSLKHAAEDVLRLEENLAQRNEELETANAQLSKANLRMKQDLEAAARIQEAVLPPRRLKLPGVQAAWLYRPCAELAGDTLNIFALDETHLGLYVIDVSGHGVAAALLAVTLAHVLSPQPHPGSILLRRNEETDQPEIVSPAEVAELLNQRFTFDENTQQYFTVVYGVLDLESGEFRFISAGHPGPIHVSAEGKSMLVEEPGMPIGIGSGAYREHSVQLHPGDRLYVYSDGLVEVMSPKGELFGKARLLALLEQQRSGSTAESLAVLWQRFEQWCGDCPIRDDVSMLALEYVGAVSRKGFVAQQLQHVGT